MRKFFSFIAITLFFTAIWPLSLGAAYSFEENSGLNTVAQESGYADQALFGQGTPIESGLGIILTAALSLLGVIFLILMVYGGLMWMTARGNEQRVDKAKSIVNDSITGLVIVAAAYAITYFVLNTFF